VLRALAWLVLAEAAVRALPYAAILRWTSRVPPSRSGRAALTPSECADAIRRAARVFPAGRCLAHAVAASCMLRRAGRVSAIRMGVGFDADRRFNAHAWLECDGTVVTGGELADCYVPFGAVASEDA
jgi:hypothetical protein